jgi:hypothetical protein
VALVVSLGPPQVAVPEVVGQPQATAETALAAVGLVRGVVSTARHPTVPAGQVISQQPVAGTLVLQGTAVDLLVSLGAPGPEDLASVLVQPTDPLILATQAQPFAAIGVLGNGSSRPPGRTGHLGQQQPGCCHHRQHWHGDGYHGRHGDDQRHR